MTGAVFSFPTTIIFGAGRIAELRERLLKLGVTRPLIVTDSGLVATPVFQKARAAAPTDAVVFSEVHSNPIAQDVQGSTKAFTAGRCDAVIGLGGGSAMDVAKVLRLC